MVGIYEISWDEVLQMSKLLARRLQGKCVWGIPRGGQLVATIMSYHGCRLVKLATEAEVIIDDIADTGGTLFRRTHDTALAVMALPTATLIMRNGCASPPNHYVVILCTEDYALFPWEDEDAAIARLAQSDFRSRDNE